MKLTLGSAKNEPKRPSIFSQNHGSWNAEAATSAESRVRIHCRKQTNYVKYSCFLQKFLRKNFVSTGIICWM